jgi:glucosyl-dolichyl phosphate glucuronosyltransferase
MTYESRGASEVDVSVVISTYNRADVLGGALQSLMEQDASRVRFEVVVVDNNSTDHTPEVVSTFRGRSPHVSYVFEPRQGVSYGRNAGILGSGGQIIAFTDDDLRVTRRWIATIWRALGEHPEVECVGGKVLPSSDRGWPKWLTRDHWAPLALFDYGDTEFYANAGRRVCLGTGNSAYRRDVFRRIGLFSTHVQAVKREPATEDHELLLRLWRSGGQGLYVPDLVVVSDVSPDRLARTYHRRWHERHGRFLAIMHDDEFERTTSGRLFGVPAHLYRQATFAFFCWLAALSRGRANRAFVHELHIRSFAGFLRARRKEFLANSSHGSLREIAIFSRVLLMRLWRRALTSEDSPR